MKHIGPHPTNEMYQAGLEINCQCARCGSSCGWVDCTECSGDGYEVDPCDGNLTGTCDCCHGYGGWQLCLSDHDWCKANPLPDRENVKRGEIEWFTLTVREMP